MTQSRGRARFGILVPYTNTNLEPDMALLCPEGVSLHVARMGGYDQDEIPDAEQMHGLGASDLDEPLRLLQGVRPDVVLYGCTSATLTHGRTFDQDLSRRIGAGIGAKTTTAAGALVNALNHLNVSRIGFASPYVPEINEMAIAFLAEAGVHTVSRGQVSSTLDNYGQGALAPQDVIELARSANHVDAEAIVLSCTDMRSVEAIAELEDMLGKPVVTSNQALMFHAMQLAEIKTEMPGFGKLVKGRQT